jgi:flagellum-specific ATP synthase
MNIERRARFIEIIRSAKTLRAVGQVTDVTGLVVRGNGPIAPLGSLCTIDGNEPLLAEVTRVSDDGIVLMPYGKAAAAKIGARISVVDEGAVAVIGDHVLGRVVNAFGEAYDGTQSRQTVKLPLLGVPLNPLLRESRNQQLVTGVRAIDGPLALAVGQRIGVFAGSGVGKTTLLSTVVRNVDADVCVICLVGERGREAESLWAEGVGLELQPRTTMVVATSDQPAVSRIRAVHFALSAAEHYRDQGKHVLLLVDSITRYAMAMREIGLSIGEPPTMRGYTPSVFSSLPKLVERCGALRGGGAITAVMTVLTETDDIDDPMAETMRSLLDGHIVMSRELAEERHYPPIDLLKSISRLAPYVSTPEVSDRSRALVADLARYNASRTIVESGLYRAGGNPELDQVLARRGAVLKFLQQRSNERVSVDDTRRALAEALAA